ncbi:MAG TPA: AsmA-like C-terminal region-containing protein [Gallionella sp.]
MDSKTVFVRTSKGEDEAHSKTMHLAGDSRRALLMVDGVSTYGEIGKRAAPSLRAYLDDTFQDLEKNGFIQDKAKVHGGPKIATPGSPALKMAPPKMAKPSVVQPDEEEDELDFLGRLKTPPHQPAADHSKQLKAEAEVLARQELEAARLKAQQEAEARARQRLEAAKLKAQQEAEAQARRELEAAKLKAQQEAEAQARRELEAAKLKAQQEAEAQSRRELEAAKLKAQQEAEAQAKRELEAAKLKAQQEAEAIRLKAEQEAASLREKTVQFARAEAEAAAKEHQLAEAARIKTEQEAARVHAELEAARLQSEQVAREHERIQAEERAARIAHEQQAQKASTAPTAPEIKPDTFSFDAFHISEQPAPSTEAPHKPVPPVKEADSSAAGKPGDFSFDLFQFDELSPQAEPAKAGKSPQHETPPPAKPDTLSFDAFRIDESRAPPPREIPPAPAAGPASRTAPEEQRKRAEQARIAAEEHRAAEAQSKKLADEQAKAEERHLAEKNKIQAEKAQFHAEHPVAGKKPTPPHPVKRPPGKPFPWGKLFGFFFKLCAFLLALLAGVLFVAPYVVPMRDYMPKVEQFMSERIKQPVHVGYLSGRILPTPRLDIGEIYIGDMKQFQAGQAQLNFSIPGLLEERKPVDSLVLLDVKVSGKGLQNVSTWLQKLVANDTYPISRMEISKGTLDADAFELRDIEGRFDFSPAGKFTSASLRAESGKYTLNMDVTPANKLEVAISVRNSALPLLPNWVFDDLTAKGELNINELTIGNFDARILGGSLQGNASLIWRSGWRAQGDFTAKTIDMKQLNNLLNGSIDGKAHFRMNSLYLADLAETATLEGDYSAGNGLINGMGIVETARARSATHLPGGRTAFDDLSGTFAYADGVYHFTQTRITSDAVNATAQFSLEKKKLSGSISARVSIQGGAAAPVDLMISGDTDSPQLRAAR